MADTVTVPQQSDPGHDDGSAVLDKRRGKGRGLKHRASSGEVSALMEIEPVDPRKVFSRGRYRSSQISVMMTRYARIRGDLLTSLGKADAEQRGHAELCRDHLRAAKAQLESPRGMLSACANLLGLADRELVCLHPPDLLSYRLRGVKDELADRDLASPAVLAQLTAMETPGTTPAFEEVRRRALKDGLTILHSQEERVLIEDDLQVTRLWRLVALAALAWLALVAVVPVVTSAGGASGDNFIWPIWAPTGQEQWDLIIAAMGLSVVGAVGGVVSGMLSVRDSRAVLSDYRTSMLKLTLKPLAGAVAAVILYLFLSAGVVSGVEVTNTGVYVVAAFLAGFSERYFLRVLRAQDDGEGTPEKTPTASVRREEPASAPPA
jgi:hypothetical protein